MEREKNTQMPNLYAKEHWKFDKRLLMLLFSILKIQINTKIILFAIFQNLGDDHPDVAKQLNNLALVCQHLHKYAEVEEYYK